MLRLHAIAKTKPGNALLIVDGQFTDVDVIMKNGRAFISADNVGKQYRLILQDISD